MSITLAKALQRVSSDLHRQSRSFQYRTDPALWIEERLGIQLWSIQKLVAQSLAATKKTAVKSCHSVGKTYLAALLICWWIDVHPSDDTVVVTTAPSNTQVKKIMWEYVRKLHAKHHLSGNVSENAEWKSDDRNVVGYGRKPADTNMNVMQGEHKKYTLVVIDEAGGIPANIWVGADAITTMDTNRILAIGNPDDPNNEFGNIFLKKQGYDDWAKFSISAFESPNFTDEKKDLPEELLSRLISPTWVNAQEAKWGKTSRLYVTRVLAQFPEESFDSLISGQSILDAQDRTIIPSDSTRPLLGVDVARFGGDLNVAVSNTGGVVRVEDVWDKTDLVESARRVDRLARAIGASEIRIDGIGVGAGVVDGLNDIDQNLYLVLEINGSGASPDLRRWYNYRAFLYDNLRDLLREGAATLPTPVEPDDEAQTLSDELEGMRYKFMRGALLMESKDDMRKRGVKSPDFADALTYAMAPFDVENPMAGYNEGDLVTVDSIDMLTDELLYGAAISPV